MKAAIFTLGCRLNAADTSLLYSRLERSGYELVSPDDAQNVPLDLILINSCAVTSEAEKKSRRLLRRLRREHASAKIVFTGCAAGLDNGELLRDAGADLVAPNPDKVNLPDLVEKPFGDRTFATPKTDGGGDFSEHATSLFPFRSRAFIKIQEGCENFCTYCIVPYVRGKERSRDFDEVIADCRSAIARNYREIVLTGVNTCAYNSRGRQLPDLLKELVAIPGKWRIRLSSTEPHPGNARLLEAMAEGGDRICRFLHLSLQHGCDRVLREMNRHYDTAEYAAFVGRARELIGDIHLGTDVIVGFPGETEADFEESCRFIGEMRFANIHIFTYSPRPGTPAAARRDQIDAETVKRRYDKLKKIADASQKAFARSQDGKILPVIFEEIDAHGMATGWSDNYLPVSVPAAGVVPGEITAVRYHFAGDPATDTAFCPIGNGKGVKA